MEPENKVVKMNGPDENKNGKQVIEPEIIYPSGENGIYGRDGNRYGWQTRYYSWNNINTSGCLSPFITLVIFLVMIAQYGFLAGIGFIFFYICGSILCSIYFTRKLMAGIIVNPWLWRIMNWLLSYLITAWLAIGSSS